ncbi:unnamed protein product, partial [Mesorhabditis spiculigera]
MPRRKQLMPKPVKRDTSHSPTSPKRAKAESPAEPRETPTTEPLECQLCREKLATIAQLQAHTIQAHVHNTHCPARLPSFAAFASHMRSHMAPPPQLTPNLRCLICHSTFPDQASRQQHTRAHFATITTRLRCSQCPDVPFQTAAELSQHARESHLRVVHRCAVCQETYDTVDAFNAHFATHSNETEAPGCVVCDVAFDSEEVLTLHIHLVHDRENSTRAPLPFPLMPQFAVPPFDFGVAKSEAQNRRIHCSVCDIECEGEEALDEHRLMAHCKVLRGDHCSVCSSSMANSSDIVAHSHIHSVDGHLSCAVCRQTVRDETHLLLHAHFHLAMSKMPDENQPAEPENTQCFRCQEMILVTDFETHLLKHESTPECPYCTDDIKLNQLLEHITNDHPKATGAHRCIGCEQEFHFEVLLQHHQMMSLCRARSEGWPVGPAAMLANGNAFPKVQRCPVCGLSFNTVVRLDAHIRKHNSTNTRAVCQICGKGFESKDILHSHMLLHKENLETAARTST